MNQANNDMRFVVNTYNRETSKEPVVEGHFVPLDRALANQIAWAFDEATDRRGDRDVIHSYAALAAEIDLQFAYLIDFGYRLEPWQQEGQPYANSHEMTEDVRLYRHLWFFTGGDPHPLLHDLTAWHINGIQLNQNDVFRAVHDCFGHAAEGFEFGPRGEENAWLHHSMMLSDAAQAALSTETRGQNSWVNFGPHAHLPVAERPYAEQKPFLLPAELRDWRTALARV
jgi:hypothetical protein